MSYTHEYRREFGDYAFYSGITPSSTQLQFMCSQVAVLFDGFTGTLIKHGRPEDVKEWLKKYAGTPLFPDLLVVEFPRDYPASEINAMIHTSGTTNMHVDRASRGEYTPET